MSEISADPQKRPYGQKFLLRRKIFRVKNLVKFYIWDCLEAKMGQKIRPWVLEDFLGPKVTTPQIWGSAEISDTKKKFFYVCTKTMPNLKNVLQIVVEIDGGGGGHSHSNRTTSKSAPHVRNYPVTHTYITNQ